MSNYSHSYSFLLVHSQSFPFLVIFSVCLRAYTVSPSSLIPIPTNLILYSNRFYPIPFLTHSLLLVLILTHPFCSHSFFPYLSLHHFFSHAFLSLHLSLFSLTITSIPIVSLHHSFLFLSLIPPYSSHLSSFPLLTMIYIHPLLIPSHSFSLATQAC